jgi:hypothetical protein
MPHHNCNRHRCYLILLVAIASLFFTFVDAFQLSSIKSIICSNPSTSLHPTTTHDPDSDIIFSYQTMSTSKKLKVNSDDVKLQTIRAGFIGCGTIACSIASGLANPDHKTYLTENGLSISSISVTRRSEPKSSMLKEKYANVVTVYEDAEDVLKNSDVVFLCVLPQHVDSMLSELKEKGAWRKDEHTLVSLVVRESHCQLGLLGYADDCL